MNDIILKYSQLGDVFDHFSLGVIVLSPERKIISINNAAESITGNKESEVIGKDCAEAFIDYPCGGQCRFYQAVKTGRISGSFDLEITDKSKEKHSITRVIFPIFDQDKALLGCVEVFQDHSTLKDLIERIRHDDKRLKIILDNLDIGILTVDCGGHITFFNTTVESLTGYKRETVLGKPCARIFGETSSDVKALLTETMTDGNARTDSDSKIVTFEGQTIPIRANYMALKNEDGRIVGGLVTISDLSLMHQLDSVMKDRYTFYDMVGRDPAMLKIFEIIPVIAASEATVLIEGPTGTGKDILTKVIHNASNRSEKPLVKVNCAALPDNLLESEMFGYVKGAFTGADKDKPGRFQEADGGTIFLDEIGDLPLSLQAKLLRVIEDREFYPLGSRRTAKVDVRIISATNQGLEQLVKAKKFREDLFYRLNVMRLELPALSERKGDIPLLIHHILKRHAARRAESVDKISEDAMEILLNHDYPGNVRELENIIEHALIICQGDMIERKHLPLSLQEERVRRTQGEEGGVDLGKEIGASENEMIREMLKKYGWNRGKTAQALNINRTTLWRKMKKYNISLS